VVVDAWNMTIDEIPVQRSGIARVELPGRQHMAIRLLLESAIS
jgi:hypothetical protein